jgi:hypothetical protein
VQSFGGQTVELLLTRPRGTNIFVHVNGKPLTWSAADGIDAADTLPGEFYVQAGASPFEGAFKGRQYAFSFLPYSVSPGFGMRIIPDGPEFVNFTAGTMSVANDTINVRGLELQTGGMVVSSSQAPGGIDQGGAYYVRHVSGFDYTLHPTEADAWADDNVIDLTSNVSNSHWQVKSAMLCVFEDESAGTIADRSGNGFDATVEGAYEKF